MTAVFGHRLGVLRGLTVLDSGRRVVGHQGPQGCVLGIVDEVCKLFVDDDQLVS